MPVMSALERSFCRSPQWQYLARTAVLPWALDGQPLSGEILEIGAGSGAMAAGAARTFGPAARITATDVDELMVETARARLAEYPTVNVARADVTALPFEGGTFDMVVSYLMLHHVVDWRSALDDITRVLKPGGALVGYDLCDTRLARLVHKVDGSPHCMVGADELAEGFAAAGLTNVTIRLSFAGHLMRFCGRR